MEINHLVNLYKDFCEKINTLNLPNVSVSLHPIAPATEAEISDLEQKYHLQIPEDIKYFWQHCPYELLVSPKEFTEGDFFNAGFDFCKLRYIDRDMPQDRALYAGKKSLEARLHQFGIGLSFSEPRLFCDLGGKGGIYFVLYDGNMPRKPIADNFTVFFAHYLASACFCSHRFDLYWDLVKAIAPLQIPLSKNKWIRFYSRVYEKNYDKL